MTDVTPTEETAPAAQAPATAPVATAGAKLVTSLKTIDFPSLGWGIHAGEVLPLPTDLEAQAVILSNENISFSK
jgi:hypothetical protein